MKSDFWGWNFFCGGDYVKKVKEFPFSNKPMNFSQNRYPPQFRIPDNPRFTFSRNTQRINEAMTNKRAEIVDTIDIHAIQASELFFATTTIVSAGKNA